MVKFGLVHRSAMNVRAVPPCAGEDARTTVPSAGVSGELVRAPTDTLVSVVAEEDASRSRIAAGITAALAIAGLGLTGAGTLGSGALESAASRLSPSRSGEPSARS